MTRLMTTAVVFVSMMLASSVRAEETKRHPTPRPIGAATLIATTSSRTVPGVETASPGLPGNPALRDLHRRVQDFFQGSGASVGLIHGAPAVIVRVPFP